jgi:hypothetical protein
VVEKRALGFCFFVGASLLAMAAYEPTDLQLNTPTPTVGAGLLAKASCQPTNLQLKIPNLK